MNNSNDRQPDWKVAIHESKHSERVISFASHGHNMSKRWWNQTYKLDQNGQLYGVYSVPSGLRRNVI